MRNSAASACFATKPRAASTYHEALGGKYVPRAVFFDLEHGVIGALRAPP
jgi:hypothetical protein